MLVAVLQRAGDRRRFAPLAGRRPTQQIQRHPQHVAELVRPAGPLLLSEQAVVALLESQQLDDQFGRGAGVG
jgi:hypothetical protein